jgi:hypothetical protein
VERRLAFLAHHGLRRIGGNQVAAALAEGVVDFVEDRDQHAVPRAPPEKHAQRIECINEDAGIAQQADLDAG